MNGVYVTVHLPNAGIEGEMKNALEDAGLQWWWNPKTKSYEVARATEEEALPPMALKQAE